MLKRMIGKPYIEGQANLFIGEDDDGIAWATNRYWAVHAKRMEPLMDRYNLPWDEPGSYYVAGSVKKLDDNPARVQDFTDISHFADELEQVKIEGCPVFARPGDHWLAMLVFADGKHIGINQEWLDWVYGYGHNKHILWDGFQIGITEDEMQMICPAHYELDGKTLEDYQDGATFVEVEYEIKEACLIGVISAFKFTTE